MYINNSKTIRLPFIKENVGSGDLVERVAKSFGIKPCDKCKKRKEILNNRLRFKPWK